MIQFKNITKIYNQNKTDEVIALQNINLSFAQGELIVLKGASGSGKSTILSLIAGMSKPTSGEVIVDGKKVSKLPDSFASDFRRQTVGFIFQKYNLITNLTVWDNIILPQIPNNPNQKELEAKLLQIMKRFHIEHKKDTLVKNLSGGEQQRVSIARAHINNPNIIIADEPTANLDQKLSLDFINILKELKTSNKTIVVATHDPLFFELDFVDRIVNIQNGQIV
jgi:putative ABC transport system ATP-binding protein